MQQNNGSIHVNGGGNGEIVIAKFNYNAQENRELSIVKNERLLLLDDSHLWWKVKRVDSEDVGYIPSNFARREKRSLLDKIISKRVIKKHPLANGHNNHSHPPKDSSSTNDRVLSLALVKFRYEAESEDEISLDKGVWVNVLQKKNDGWWLIQFDKQRGWFPSNYLIEKTNDGLSSLSLLNQIQHQHSSSINSPSSSSNGLSSSSSANSNIETEHTNNNVLQQVPLSLRHNSHPPHISSGNDEYAFVIKPPKFAHSDGTLDSCFASSSQQQQSSIINGQKNSSWCASSIQQHHQISNSIEPLSGCTSSSALSNDTPMTMIADGLTTLTLKSSSSNRNQQRHSDSPYANEMWYFGMLSRDEAEKLLRIYGTDRGDYLIRDSERRIGNYSLSIRADDETIRHFRIESIDDGARLVIGKRSFNSLYELIEHYKTHPVYDADQNYKLYMNKPLSMAESSRP